MTTDISPNAPILGTATEHTAVTPLDATIAEKMSAMLAQRDAARKQAPVADDTVTGDNAVAMAEAPVAPDNVDDIVEPEDSTTKEYVDDSTDEAVAPEEVSEAEEDSTASELIDFIEFANDNPNAKFKFTRNGKEVIIDAKKAAAILGQGSAIHEEARELKVQKAEFEEFQKAKKEELEGLSLVMSFTVQPRLKQAYEEISKTQGYQNIFHQQLAATTDPGERAQIEANIAQNENWINQQKALVRSLQPKIEQFQEHRKKQVAELLETSRKQFKDKELKNSFVYNELRDKLADSWTEGKIQVMPGITTLDLVTADEHILSLIRDGFKYRDKPKSTSAGASIAALAGKKTGATSQAAPKKDQISELRDKANKGDRKAAQNLLEARMAQIRAGRR